MSKWVYDPSCHLIKESSKAAHLLELAMGTY